MSIDAHNPYILFLIFILLVLGTSDEVQAAMRLMEKRRKGNLVLHKVRPDKVSVRQIIAWHKNY